MRTKYLFLATMPPVIIADLWCHGVFLIWTMMLIFIYIFLIAIFPLLFRYSYDIQKKMVFVKFLYWPFGVDLCRPETVGLKGARNFYLHTDENVKLGVWQILPQSLIKESVPETTETYENLLKNATRPIFLYMHGNSGNRAMSHRVELYKLLQQLDFHVICFDYRCYGDSEDVDLTEIGIVNDSKYVLEWLIKFVDKSAQIYVWGHSLGTGVSSHVLDILSSKDIKPAALFLESPFNNLADEISEHPFSQLFKYLPWFHWAFIQPPYDNGIRFESDKHIVKIQCPIMILHAEDDSIVPISLGEKLFSAAKLAHSNNEKQIQMIRIDSIYGLGHKYICRYKDLPKIIENFLTESSSRRKM